MTDGLLQVLAPVVHGFRRRLGVVVALSVLGGLLEAAVLVVVVDAASRLTSDDATRVDLGPARLGTASVGAELTFAAVLVLARIVCQLGASWVSAGMAGTVQHRLRTGTIRAFVAARWAVQASEPEGQLAHVAVTESDRAATAGLTLASLIAAGCNLGMLVAVAVAVSPVAAIATVAVVVPLYFALRPVSHRARRQASLRSRRELDVARTVTEAVRTAEDVRVFGVGSAVVGTVDRQAAAAARHTARVHFLSLNMTVLYQSAALGLVLAALVVINLVRPANLEALAATVLILLRAFSYSQQAQTNYHQLHSFAPSVERVAEQRARYDAAADDTGRTAIGSLASIRLDGVSYDYGSGRLALDDVTLDVPRGTTLGIIGPSGAGKSTLVQILLRLRRPTRGTLLVNGRDAADFLAADWAALVAHVPQDPMLIAGSVTDNVRFHRPHISDEEVVRACHEAHIHDDIVTWAHGYGATVGERGLAVSGGQRQRLCLARALAGRPALLVLDEPTSALDLRSESLVQRSLRDLRGRTTIVIIAHRLSTLNVCDLILVLDRGRVEAIDAPDVLAARTSGFYREAVELSRLV